MVKTLLPNKSYLVRKLQTNLTQILHRVRLRPFASSKWLPDITVSPEEFQQDDEVIIQNDDLYAFAWQEIYKEYELQQPENHATEPALICSSPRKEYQDANPDTIQESQTRTNKVENQDEMTDPDHPKTREDNT